MIQIRSAMIGLALSAILVAGPGAAFARGGGGHHSGGRHHASSESHHASSSRASRSKSTSHRSLRSGKAAVGVKRDAHGRIARSAKAKAEFRAKNPCPATGSTKGACSGYVIDHVKALKRGGADDPSNMQWQTKAAAKEKDKRE